MLRSAIIIFLVNYCAFLFSQNIHLSRNFEARKKNIPLEILNDHASYFYVLRLNNAVHDITLERRAKPSAEMIAFTPLKLDSINAGWFDYEELDHLFFEQDNKVYFLFEKVLNSKKTIYLKIIDTTGKASGFIELASQERDKTLIDFEYSFKRTVNNNILIIGSKYGVNGMTRKVATLFDIRLKKSIWTKKLPLEITATEFSCAFDCNAKNDLFYTKVKSLITGYESLYKNDVRYTIPILRLDSLWLVKWESAIDFPVRKPLETHGMTSLRNASILPNDTAVFFSLQGYRERNEGDAVEGLIVNTKLNASNLDEIYSRDNFYTDLLKEQLTFYDSPQKEFYYKEHKLLKSYRAGASLYTVLERTEGYYHKELVFWRTDMDNGEVQSQKIVPRKIFFFKNRTRFKSMGIVMSTLFKDSLKLLVLENPSNFRKDPDVYNYKEFKKETKLYNSNLVCYSMKADGHMEKRLVFRNADFDLVPLHYEGQSQKDVVFYLNNSKYEKFAILKLYP